MISEVYQERQIHRLPARMLGETSKWPQFELVNSSDAAVNLTGATVEITWRRKTPKGRIVLSQSSASGGINIVSATEGRISLDQVTLNWKAGLYIADIKVTHPSWTEVPMRLELLIVEGATK